MKKLALLLTLSLAVALVACGPKIKHDVSESELAALSPEERGAIDAARSEVEQATGVLNQAKSELDAAKRQHGIAKEETKRAKADLAIAKTQHESATTGGDAEEMLQSKERLRKAELTLSYHQAEEAHQAARVNLAAAKLDESEALHLAARAKVEAEKAKALQLKKGDTSPEAQEKLAAFQKQAAEASIAHAKKRGQTAKAQEKAEKMRDKAEAARQNIPS